MEHWIGKCSNLFHHYYLTLFLKNLKKINEAYDTTYRLKKTSINLTKIEKNHEQSDTTKWKNHGIIDTRKEESDIE